MSLVHGKHALIVPFVSLEYQSSIFTTVKSFARRIKQDNTTTSTKLLQNVYAGQWFGGKLDSFVFTPIKAYCIAVLGSNLI